MTEQPPLTDIIQKKRLMLFVYLARMDETADARRILTGVHQSDWSRPVVCPYTSWMATLKNDLSLHNLTFEDAIELALDKSLWRLLVVGPPIPTTFGNTGISVFKKINTGIPVL